MSITRLILSALLIILLTTITFQSSITGSQRENDSGKTVFQQTEYELEFFPGEFILELYPDTVVYCTLRITNTSDDLIWFESKLRGIGEEEDQHTWDLLLSWNVTEAVDDNRINGIVYVEDRWIISGGANDVNYFYIFNRDGNFTDSLRQPVEDRYGIRDMTYYNGYIWCSDQERNLLIEINPDDGTIRRSFSLHPPFGTQSRITIDPNTDNFIVSDIINWIYELELRNDSLSIVNEFHSIDPRDDMRIRKYGLSWFEDDPDGFLQEFSLEQNYPNPFNSTTQIGYRISVSGDVRISVLDILGREVAVLVDERKQAGFFTVDFSSGNLVSGIYFYVLDTGKIRSVRKMVLVR